MRINKLNAIIVVLLCLLLAGCNFTPQPQNNSAPQIEQEYFTQSFPQCGFSIKTPCKLYDVSGQSNEDFFVNYGGIDNENDPQRMAAYQIAVIRLPAGYKPSFEDDLYEYIRKNFLGYVKDVENGRFSHEGYPGCVGTTMFENYQQKAVVFIKENFVILLTVISNDNLEQRFNKLTNGFKVIE